MVAAAADEAVLPCEVAVVACRESVIGIGKDGIVVVREWEDDGRRGAGGRERGLGAIGSVSEVVQEEMTVYVVFDKMKKESCVDRY